MQTQLLEVRIYNGTSPCTENSTYLEQYTGTTGTCFCYDGKFAWSYAQASCYPKLEGTLAGTSFTLKMYDGEACYGNENIYDTPIVGKLGDCVYVADESRKGTTAYTPLYVRVRTVQRTIIWGTDILGIVIGCICAIGVTVCIYVGYRKYKSRIAQKWHEMHKQ